MSDLHVRGAATADFDGIWAILEPTIRAGETFALPRDGTRDAMLDQWFAPGHDVFVAEDEEGGILVANAAFTTHAATRGRGVDRAMALHAMDTAAAAGFLAMQFNFVIATNTRAVALWKSLGFAKIGRVPGAFRHRVHGLVDALIMHRFLLAPTRAGHPA